MRAVREALCVLGAAVLVACSATPPRNEALPGRAVSADGPTADRERVTRRAADQRPTVNAQLVKQGYRPVKRGEQLVYCREQTQTGSLIAATVCLTESQVRTLEQNAQRSRDRMIQPSGGRNCPRADCSVSGG